MTRRECNIEGCRRRFSAKGMCRRHYRQAYSKVTPDTRGGGLHLAITESKGDSECLTKIDR